MYQSTGEKPFNYLKIKQNEQLLPQNPGCTRGCPDSSLSGLPGSRIYYAGHSEEEENYSDLKPTDSAFQACFDGAVTTGCTHGCLNSSLSGLPGSRICYAGHLKEDENYSDLKLWVYDRFIREPITRNANA